MLFRSFLRFSLGINLILHFLNTLLYKTLGVSVCCITCYSFAQSSFLYLHTALMSSEELFLLVKSVFCRGDYRSGKRLNIRKLIAYVASNYRKNRIWLRRTKRHKRNYQLLIAVDDSKSMQHNNTRQVRITTSQETVIGDGSR